MTTTIDPLGACRDYQREALSNSRAAFDRGVWSQLIVSATGSGKAQPIDEPVLTPSGWRHIGDLRVGDPVVDVAGGTCRVTGVYPQGVRDIVRVTTADGATTRCDHDHLWLVRPQWNAAGYRTMTAADLMASAARWYLPLVEPVDFEPATLPLHPYLLGVLIGDGGLSIDGRVLVTTHDDVVDQIRRLLPPPCTITRMAPAGTANTWIIGGPTGSASNPTMDALRALGLMGCRSREKFVPAPYLRGSSAQRLALLQGLCDTDGHVPRAGAVSVEWTTASERLAEDVRDVVRSLGGIGTLHERETTWAHAGERRRGRAWRLSIRLTDDLPVWIERKASRLRASTRPLARRIESVQPDGQAEAVCIAVDGTAHLYVTRDYLVTHNTVIFAHLTHAYADWLAQFPAMQQKVLVLAHRDRLLDQSAEKIQHYNRDLRIGTEQAGRRHSPFDDVVCASVQTLTAGGGRRLRQFDPNAFRIVVVDEAHRVAAAGYQTVLAHFGLVPPRELCQGATSEADQTAARTRVREWWAQGWPNRLLVGVTATPSRTDLVGLEWTFREVVYERPLRWYIERGYLAPLSGYVLRTSVSVDSVKRTAGDFNQGELGKLLNTPQRNEAIVRAWGECAADRRASLAFCVDVAHARDLAAAFRRAGVAADSIAGEDDDRDARLAEFERGDLQVLCNCQLLTEGVDIPVVDCVVMAAPTQSQIRYMQAIGRGTRLAEGKTDCLILDVVDDSRKYTLQTSGDMFGLPPRFNAQGADLLKVARAIEAAEARQPALVIDTADLTPETLTAQLERVDLWGTPHASGTPLTIGRLAWSELRPQRYTIAIPPQAEDGRVLGGAVALPEVVTVAQNLLGAWAVDVRCGTRVVDQVAVSLDALAPAIERAERWIQHHRPHAWGMFQRSARWRELPASDKQLRALARLGAPPALLASITKGRASDMLDAYYARTRR